MAVTPLADMQVLLALRLASPRSLYDVAGALHSLRLECRHWCMPMSSIVVPFWDYFVGS